MDSSLSEGASLLTDQDIYLFREGSHFRLYDKLGAHPLKLGGAEGVLFAVWAPNARRVSVLGEFNGWQPESHPLQLRRDGTGIWEGFVPDLGPGTAYKYRIVGPQGYQADKGDPFARYWETPPQTASIVWDLGYDWGDRQWMERRADVNALDRPWSIYELHAGSWRRAEDGGFLNWRELAEQLADYVHHMGYTHVELLPVMEHPFYGSWGYQSTGLFAPTARYGSPQDFMYLIDHLHQRGIGVILDWVPSHFPDDVHGLVYFDGTYLFEHADPKRGFQPDWHSYIYNYGRYEVRAFLISSALFWLDKYHADGLRVDAVASMLYLDYGRREGEWIPNEHGGRENLEAVSFLRTLNEAVYRDFPQVQTIAEESTAWPMVSRPNYMGGLGFGMKWNMGWMHDTLGYMAQDPVYRKYHQDQLTFSIWYAFSENFVLPLSHDEVVYGKGSLIGRMPGDDWQKFANLRLLLGYMYAHPGKKLTFMGGEFGQRNEWNHDVPLDWDLLELDAHQGIQRWVRDVNHLYRQEPTLHQHDFDQSGFQWVDTCNWEQSVLSFLRRGSAAGEWMLVVCNFTPVVRHNYVVGVPAGGWWAEALNSDASAYGGSGVGNLGGVEAAPVGAQGLYHSLVLELPPLAMMFFKRAADGSRP